MPKYALLIYSHGAEFENLTEADQAAVMAEYGAVSQTAGMFGGGELHPPEAAKTVRVRNAGALTTDGPFAETKDAVGGFYLLEADSLEAAVAVAERIPGARHEGGVEVRQIVER